MRRAEPWVVFRAQSLQAADSLGLSEVVLKVIASAREVLQGNPSLFGEVRATGTRDPGTIQHAARSVEYEYQAVGRDLHLQPTEASARVPARVFIVIMNDHPYFDGNKRTGVLSAAIIAAMLGFDFQDSGYVELAEEVRILAARAAPIEEVAQWLADRLLVLPKGDKVPMNHDNSSRAKVSQAESAKFSAEIREGARQIAEELAPLLKALAD